MALYEYECLRCREISETYVPIAELENDVVVCTTCHREAVRIISSPKGGDVSDYARKNLPSYGKYDESLNMTFHSTSEKKKYLKEKGLREIPEGVHGIPTRKKGVTYFTP